MDEHVAAPDPVDASVREGHRLDRRLDHLDAGARLRHGCPGELDVPRQRVERDDAEVVLALEPNRVARVARADVDEHLAGLRAELGESLEEPVGTAGIEALRDLLLEIRLAGPDLVELLDRCHQPPAMAGRRMTVELSVTGVSSSSRTRMSSPST